jgi:hypothetical protein
VAGLLVFLLAAAPAAAKNRHCPPHNRAPHGNSEASQYVESVPGACGNQSIGQANGNGQSGSSAGGSASGGSGGGGSTSAGSAVGASTATGAGSVAGGSKAGSENAASTSLRKLKSQGGWGATVAALTHATAPLGALVPSGGSSGGTGASVAAHQVSDGSPLGAVGDISPGVLAVALAGGAGFLALGLLRRRQTQ